MTAAAASRQALGSSKRELANECDQHGGYPIRTIPSALGEYAADPSLPLTITHLRHGDAEFTVGGADTACLVLILSEGQIAERRSRGVWSQRPSKSGLVTVTDPDELTKLVPSRRWWK